MNDNKKVLIRIQNLKQYFPLKKKGLYVKANDGISLDIYEGETFGLVGESGCGKSTLGRVILQLYRQTDGRTMYYGRKLDSMVPKYVQDTVSNAEHLRAHVKELTAKRDAAVEKYEAVKARQDALPEEKKGELNEETFAAMNEREHAEKALKEAFLGLTELIGGFYAVEDLSEFKRDYLAAYSIAQEIVKIDEAVSELEMNERDLAGQIEDAQKEGKNTSSLEAKKARVDAKLAENASHRASRQQALDQAHAVLDQLRARYADDPEFQKYEAFRDDGINLSRLTYSEIRHLRKDLQLIFQDPYSSLNARMTVGQIIGEGLLAHNMFKSNNERMQKYVMQTMEDCGLAPYMIHRYPHQFSGGQRQRIGIARSLAVKPKFVVCDEAVSALDVSIQSQIINLLQDLKEKENLTYMFISHDLSVVKYISDRIGVMYLGNIVELADKKEIFENPRHPYTEALLSAIPTTDVDQKKELVLLEGDIPSPINPPKGCKFHTRCRYCTEICTAVTPEPQEVSPGHFVACHHMLSEKQ